MEFADLGKRCTVAHCNQQDYLPFQCDDCQKFHCLAHKSDHECPNPNKGKQAFPCPFCLQPVRYNHGQNQEIALKVHQQTDKNCNAQQLQKTQDKMRIKCGMRKCYKALTDLNQHTCQRCRLKYCLKHRFDDDHDCNPVSMTPKQPMLKMQKAY